VTIWQKRGCHRVRRMGPQRRCGARILLDSWNVVPWRRHPQVRDPLGCVARRRAPARKPAPGLSRPSNGIARLHGNTASIQRL
jgi:hypothetical protein